MPKKEFTDYYGEAKFQIKVLESLLSNLKKSVNRVWNSIYVENKKIGTGNELKKGLKLLSFIRKQYKCTELINQKLKDKEEKLKSLAKEIFRLLNSKKEKSFEKEEQEDFYLNTLFF